MLNSAVVPVLYRVHLSILTFSRRPIKPRKTRSSSCFAGRLISLRTGALVVYSLPVLPQSLTTSQNKMAADSRPDRPVHKVAPRKSSSVHPTGRAFPLRTFSPFLLQQFEEGNRPRVVRRNFARLREAVAIHKWKRCARAKADAMAAASLQRRTLRGLHIASTAAASARLLKVRADDFCKRALIRSGWEALWNHPAERKVMNWLTSLLLWFSWFVRKN